MHLEIDGERHEIPAIGSFDMDENRVFFRATGMHAEDVWLGLQSEEMQFADLLAADGFLEAIAHIAYRREHDHVNDDEIKAMIGKQNRLGLWASLIESVDPDGGEEGKGEGTTSVPSRSSTSSNDEKPSTTPPKDASSGTPSTPSSARPADDPETTGTSGSGSEPTSAHLRQVV